MTPEIEAKLVDSLYAIAGSLDNVANALKPLADMARYTRDLGNGNASTEMGALEALGVVFKEGFDGLSTEVHGLADVIATAEMNK